MKPLDPALAQADEISGCAGAEDGCDGGKAAVQRGAPALHQLVLEREKRLDMARIALPAAAALKLAVDAAAVMPLAEDDIEAAERGHARAQLDVRPPPGHVGGDRHRARLTRAGDDGGLVGILPGREHLMRDTQFAQGRACRLGGRDRARAEQYRRTSRVQLLHPCADCRPFRCLAPEYPVARAAADIGQMGGDARHREPVDPPKLHRRIPRRAGHRAQIAIAAEIALIGDPPQRLAQGRRLQPFLQLDHLVEPFGPCPVRHHPAGIFVNDLHLAVAQDVVDVPVKQEACGQCLNHRMFADHRHAKGALVFPGDLFQPLDTRVAQVDPVLVRHHPIIDTLAQAARRLHRAQEQAVIGSALRFDLARYDQRRARLVDQHAVALVNERQMQAAHRASLPVHTGDPVHLVRQVARAVAQFHPVAQVIEGKLLVGAIDDIAAIDLAALGRLLTGKDRRHAETKEAIDRRHFRSVAFGEVVVHRDHMHGHAHQPGGCRGERGAERLALPGAHLRDHAAQHRPGAEHLHIVMAHPKCARRRLAHQREGPPGLARGEPREIGAAAKFGAQLPGGVAQLRVARGAELGLVPGGGGKDAAQPACAQARAHQLDAPDLPLAPEIEPALQHLLPFGIDEHARAAQTARQDTGKSARLRHRTASGKAAAPSDRSGSPPARAHDRSARQAARQPWAHRAAP